MFETTEGVVTLEIVPVLFVLTPNNRNEEGECPASVLELAAEVPEGLGFAFALSRTTSSSSICFVSILSDQCLNFFKARIARFMGSLQASHSQAVVLPIKICGLPEATCTTPSRETCGISKDFNLCKNFGVIIAK